MMKDDDDGINAGEGQLYSREALSDEDSDEDSSDDEMDGNASSGLTQAMDELKNHAGPAGSSNDQKITHGGPHLLVDLAPLGSLGVGNAGVPEAGSEPSGVSQWFLFHAHVIKGFSGL